MIGRPHILERVVTGRQIQLPLLHVVAGAQNRKTLQIPWHSHTCFELLFVLDGGTGYEIADGRQLDLVGGQFFVVPPGVVHRGMQSLRTPSNVCGVSFHPEATAARRNTPFTASNLEWFTRQCVEHALCVCPMGGELRRLVATLCCLRDDFAREADRAGAAASFRLAACGVILKAVQQLAEFRGLQHPEKFATAVAAHVESHYEEPLRAVDLARAVGCSRSRLFELFKQNTGMTPTDYVQRFRVKKAGQLLVNSSRSVTDIALSTGFSSGQYFCKVFRKYAGKVPGEFRRRRPT